MSWADGYSSAGLSGRSDSRRPFGDVPQEDQLSSVVLLHALADEADLREGSQGGAVARSNRCPDLLEPRAVGFLDDRSCSRAAHASALLRGPYFEPELGMRLGPPHEQTRVSDELPSWRADRVPGHAELLSPQLAPCEPLAGVIDARRGTVADRVRCKVGEQGVQFDGVGEREDIEGEVLNDEPIGFPNGLAGPSRRDPTSDGRCHPRRSVVGLELSEESGCSGSGQLARLERASGDREQQRQSSAVHLGSRS